MAYASALLPFRTRECRPTQARAAMAAATGPTAKDGEPREAPGVAVADSKAASAAEAGKPSLVTTGKRPRESQSLALTEASSKVKWKKLATSELTRKGGSMKLKMLTAAVLASAGRGEESAAELLQKLESSGRFSLREKHIALVGVDSARGGDAHTARSKLATEYSPQVHGINKY